MDEKGAEFQYGVLDGSASPVEVQRDDGFLQEMRNLALNLVVQVPRETGPLRIMSNDDQLTGGDEVTVRLAKPEDVKTICELRYAQSIEYAGLSATGEACRLFYTETEAYVRRNINTRVYFAFMEQAGEVISMSGLEIADKMPLISVEGNVERSATVVACYTLPHHRGKGNMRHMLSLWSMLAPLLGIDVIYLESRNPSMQMLAFDQGYDCVSEKYRLSPDSFGRTADIFRVG